MLFQSWQYLLLLAFCVAGIKLIPYASAKKCLILAASILFYACGGGLQTILFISVITMAYFEGRILQRFRSKCLLGLMLLLLFLPLISYKYLPFLCRELFHAAFPQITLPIGISFYTFQAVAYVIDVYRRKIDCEIDYLSFACFVSFFPQLIAGPIERSHNLLQQVREFRKPTDEELSIGFRHILLGLTLKLLVAETMASYVDPVYNNIANRGGFAILIATFFFGIQIYCDFNGYSQIAIGSAKMMGINLMNNFDHPYTATGIGDFWHRWHISLSSWFKDYIYIPLGGNRKGLLRTILNTIITFTVSGVWHGANWTFALWGFANGCAVASERLLVNQSNALRKHRILHSVLAYLAVNLFWVLFRANTISDAFLAYRLILTDTLPQLISLDSLTAIKHFLSTDNSWSFSLLFSAFFSFVIYIWYEYGNCFNLDLTGMLHSNNRYIRWITYVFLILITLYFGKTLSQGSYVYFRF